MTTKKKTTKKAAPKKAAVKNSPAKAEEEMTADELLAQIEAESEEQGEEMGIDLEDFILDESLENDGAWQEFQSGTRFKIASIENPDFVAMRQKELKKYEPIFQAGRDIPLSKKLEITRKCIAHTVLKDWSGFRIGGKEIKYSPDRGMQVMKQSRPIADFVSFHANRQANYLQKSKAEAIKK